jgi:carboxyl-terminal processing protease
MRRRGCRAAYLRAEMRSSRPAFVICGLALVLCLCAGFVGSFQTRAATAFPAGLDRIDRAQLYDAVVETIENKFYDPSRLKQLDWSSRVKAIRPSVLAAATTEDAVHQVNSLLAELKTSHTVLLTPDDYDYYVLLDIVGTGLPDFTTRLFWGMGPNYPGIGAFTRLVDGRHFVDGVLEGSPAERAGLLYGDEILSVDGQPYSPVAAFRAKVGTTVDLEIRRRAEGAPQHQEISVVSIRPTIAFSNATEASARVIERDDHRIGYIHIWASHEANSFNSALARLSLKASKPPDLLVVDMRGRVGGSAGVARAFLETMDAGTKSYFGEWKTFDRSDRHASFAAPENHAFRGRSALLINEHTRSAAEIMAFGYKRGSFGPVIGTPSAGAVMGGALYVMPGDLLLYVAVAGMTFDNQPLEGIGVAPDYRVERPLAYAAGVDPVLDAAADILVKRTQK